MATVQARPRATARGTGSAGWGLVALRICLGVFFLFMGIGKLGWAADAGPLTAKLNGWLEHAHPWSRWYIDAVALPAVPIFARVVLVAELATGVALITGFWTRLAAALAVLMVLNFHFASSAMLAYGFLTNGYGLPVLGGLLALAIGAKGLPWSVRE